ncbi:HAD family hydrolase [Clostridium sediminicola]|uniref:HAD family hydrolase n=1 Tax=Clostridium sediminicola TaxID=3114879 RepID=UPI0031F230C5
MYKHILFDLDGTLTDSKYGIIKSIQYALSKEGIEQVELKDLQKFVGPPLKESFMEYYSFDEETAERAIDNFREYFKDKGIFENEVYIGIPELLSYLKNKGYCISIATSKPTIFAKKIIKHFKLEKYFLKIVGSNLDGTRTSKGEVIEYLLKELDVKNTDKIVMIGDRKHDVLGAKMNNLHSIGVAYGYGCIEELESAGANYIVESIDELYKKFA